MPESPPTYRIARWRKTFEHRDLRRPGRSMPWVKVPTHHDGDGLTELLQHPNGVAHYGIWVLLLGVGSRCSPRGVLIRKNSSPHTSATVARIVRSTETMAEEAWLRFISIGWLEPRPKRAQSAPRARQARAKARPDKMRSDEMRSKTPPPPVATKRDTPSGSAGGGDASPGRKAGKPCSECTDGAILEDGRIVRCCGCPKGYARAKALRSASRAEEREATARSNRPADEPRDPPAVSSEGRTLTRGPDEEEIVDPDTGRVLPAPGRKK